MKNITTIILVLLTILFGVLFLNTHSTVLSNHLPEICFGIYLGLLVKSFKKTFN